jgi:capsular polysaccharide transport system permease protein
MQAQLDTMRKNLPEDAPGLSLVRDRLDVLRQQLATERAKSVSTGDDRSAADILNEFAKLKLEAEFASKAYLSALASLESARADAQKQSLFLEAFVSPQLPQTAEYPKRATSILLVFIASFLVWAIGGLFVAVAREHL